MKTLDIFLSSLVLCISSLPLIVVLLTLQQDPSVPANPPLDQAQVREIQQLLIDNDPRQLLASDNQEVRLTETELNALITYLKNNNPVLASISVHADLLQDATRFALSIPVEIAGLLRFFNITLWFAHEGDSLVLDRVDAGALSIPSLLLTPIKQALVLQLAEDNNYQLVAAFAASLHFRSIDDERVVIMVDWRDGSLEQIGDQARQVFVSAREAERLRFYHEKLVTALEDLPSGISRLNLNDLLRPLFVFASINSAGGASAIAENRAVFIVLSTYLTDLELSQLTGSEVELETPRELTVVLESREDLARHVVTSAAISASAGATMAEVLSVYKEVHDARYRTGFSFTDIAANQAGSLLGTLASRSETDALLFQQMMTGITNESDYLPPLGTYDGMTEAEFTERYGSRESESYLQRLQEIADSIAARPFYQAFAE